MDSHRSVQSNVVDLISEELGILADLIFTEIIEEIGIRESDLSRYHAGKFVRILDAKLPEDMGNRQQVIRDVGQLLIHIR